MSLVILQHHGQKYTFDPTHRDAVIRLGGKFNSVYKGCCENDQKPVIIKKLNPERTQNAGSVASFQREHLLNVLHPNISQSIAYIEQNGSHYLIREYISGSNLKEIISLKKIPAADQIPYFLQVLDALAALHDHQIIHCDVRPANIMIEDASQRVRLIDLGLAMKKNTTDERRPFAMIYSSPEQLLSRNGLIDETSDLYSTGVSLYETLSGETPFHHSNPQFMTHLQLTQPLRPHKKIAKPIFDILLKATYKYSFPKPPSYYVKKELDDLLLAARRQRYQSASEMKEALSKAL